MSYKFNPFTGTLDEVGAGGGAATPGGADTQVQFNDGGALGGDSGLTYNDTAGALNVGGKTVTTDAPVINLSQTWNSATTTFTGLKLNVTNTASAAGSNLLDLQVGGVSKLGVEPGGAIAGGNNAFVIRTFGTNNFDIFQGSSRKFQVRTTGVRICRGTSIAWANSTTDTNVNPDTGLKRDSAGVVKVTDGFSGTGYLKLIPTTVSALTAAATVGAGTKAFVTDSANTLSSHHGQTVAGGGSNFVPIYSDGTNWIVG